MGLSALDGVVSAYYGIVAVMTSQSSDLSRLTYDRCQLLNASQGLVARDVSPDDVPESLAGCAASSAAGRSAGASQIAADDWLPRSLTFNGRYRTAPL
jgi:hypothetical protein